MPATATDNFTVLPADSNQALGIANYAIDFLKDTSPHTPSPAVLKRTALFHTDSVFCALSALALRTNAPTVLRAEALEIFTGLPAGEPDEELIYPEGSLLQLAVSRAGDFWRQAREGVPRDGAEEETDDEDSAAEDVDDSEE